MKKFIITIIGICLLSSYGFSEKVNHKWSYKDFTNKQFINVSAQDFNHTTIKRSCFMQNTPNALVFPNDMTGVTFDRCNLDNVHVPEGNTVLPNCTHKKIIVEDGKTNFYDQDDNLLFVQEVS